MRGNRECVSRVAARVHQFTTPPPRPPPATDNVGDNVGDIAGMGADLFGSFAESTCAALVIASVSSLGTNLQYSALSFPLLISAVGILGCFLTSLVALYIFPAKAVEGIERALKTQLIVSTIVLTPVRRKGGLGWVTLGDGGAAAVLL